MPTWIFYALLAAFFAGLTSVLAKYGIGKINSDLGLADQNDYRICFCMHQFIFFERIC